MEQTKVTTFQPGNPGKPKGAISRTTKVRLEFAEMMQSKIDRLSEILDAADDDKFTEYMKDFAPYYLSKRPTENNVNVTTTKTNVDARLLTLNLEQLEQLERTAIPLLTNGD